MRCIAVRQRNVCYFLYEIADNDYRLHIRMNHVPKPQEEKLCYYFQSWTCLGVFETHVLLCFLRSFLCKWPVINVTLLTLKIAVHKIQD